MSLNIVVTADVAAAGQQIDDFSKKSRIALNSLSLVAADLPFGFIGIQNNLPGVISAFGELRREAGSVGGALKQLGNALIGPAGLFFALNATISVITSLVQKYGSLGAAITDIFGLQVKLRDIQNSLNAEYSKTLGNTAGEIANLNSLETILISTNSTLKERGAAYSELNKAYPGILQGIDKEKALSGDLNEIIATRIKLFATQIELEGKAEAIKKLISQSAEEQLKLGAKLKTGGYFDVLGIQLKGFFQTGDAGIGGVIKSIQNTFGKTTAETNFFTGELINVNKELSQVNEEVDKLIKASKEKIKKPKVEGLGKVVRGEVGMAIDSPMTPELANKLLIANLKLAFGKTGIFTRILERSFEDRKRTINKKIKEEATLLVPKKVNKIAGVNISEELEKQIGAFVIFRGKLEENQALLNQTFFSPLQNAFANLFETGKFGFKAFADAVLMAIKQLVSKIIATGIISLIANLLTPGAGVIGGGAAGILGRVGGDILRSIGIGGPGVANPSFGGVGPGAMGMSGQVNVVLRGSDLVGALNRTNATINRVG